MLILQSPDGRKRINRAVWGPLNQTIVSGGEDTVIRIWDAEVIQFSSLVCQSCFLKLLLNFNDVYGAAIVVARRENCSRNQMRKWVIRSQSHRSVKQLMILTSLLVHLTKLQRHVALFVNSLSVVKYICLE